MISNPEVRDIYSTDWDGSPVTMETPRKYFLFEIGASGQSGADTFYIGVCNPFYLGEEILDGAWSWRFQLLVMNTLSVTSVRTALNHRIHALGPHDSWPVLAERLDPYVDWELKGMKYPTFD